METPIHGHEHGHNHQPHLQEVEFHVNNKPVHMPGHVHTGLEIKKAAIAQGVKIKLDFLLYLEHEHQPNEPIGDDQDVKITQHSRFRAIGDDDNS